MQDFDELLSDVLQQEARAEPLHGLEDRVLLRVRSVTTRQRTMRRWSGIGLAGALAMALLTTEYFWPKRSVVPDEPATVQVTARRGLESDARVKPDEPMHPTQARLARVVNRSHHEHRGTETEPDKSVGPHAEEPLPKLDVFPAPATPTPQELMLRRLAEPTDYDAASAAAALLQQQWEPVHIAEIHIKPILEERP